MLEKLIMYIVSAHKKAVENNGNCNIRLERKEWGKILDIPKNKHGITQYQLEINKTNVLVSVNKLGGGYGVLTLTINKKEIGLPLIYDGYINIIVSPRRDLEILQKLNLEEAPVECYRW